MGKGHDLTGRTFNRLYVIEKISQLGQSNQFQWLCKCSCGNECIVRSDRLMSGKTRSCGCLQKEIISEGKFNLKHGMKGTSIYEIWRGMLSRCHNSLNKDYEHYGGRGIKVCDRWHVFNNFYEDMGDRPRNLTLERENNYEGYSPENCKWATIQEQSFNRRIIGKKNYYWDLEKQKYRIIFRRNKRRLFFGYCNTELEATEKAEAARIALDVFPRLEGLI